MDDTAGSSACISLVRGNLSLNPRKRVPPFEPHALTPVGLLNVVGMVRWPVDEDEDLRLARHLI
jgi:hypothetical protein